MEQYKVLSQKEVIDKGAFFDGDIVCYGGEYGQQVCNTTEDGTQQPITGIVYELYNNSKLNYYCYYVDGISNGSYVCFYDDGTLKSISSMFKGTKHGKSIQWHEDGTKQSEGIYKYGFCQSLIEWDKNGKVVKEQIEPSEFDKKMIKKYEKYEKYEQKKHIN